MSAPDTNIAKQERQHKGPLTGMALGIGFVAVIALAFLTWVVANGNNPGEEATTAIGTSTITVEPAPLVPATPSGDSAENSGATISSE